MANATTKTLIFGDLQVSFFDFAKAGDDFPVHVHTDAATSHISILARGSIVCQGAAGIAGRVLNPGDVVDWPLHQEHGFTATADATRLINVRKVVDKT